MMKPKGILTILIAIVIIGAIIYLKPASQFPGDQKSKGGPGKMPALPVTAYVCKAETLSQTIESSGSLLAFQEVDIVSEVSGKVVRIPFGEGSFVAKNDLLVKIYDTDLQIQLQKLKIQKELIEKNEIRQKQLLLINAISQQEYDDIKNQLNTIDTDIEALKNKIEKTEIRAPFSGVMGLKDINEGSYVIPSMSISRLQAIDQLKIDFSIPEKYKSQISNGMQVDFFQEGVKDTRSGVVYAIDPMIDATTRTIHLRAKFTNTQTRFFPGSFVKIRLKLQEIPDAIMIPTEAVVPQLKGQKVFLIKQGKAVPQNVELGIRSDARVQISKGLQASDTIITLGVMQVKPKASVKIIQINK